MFVVPCFRSHYFLITKNIQLCQSDNAGAILLWKMTAAETTVAVMRIRTMTTTIMIEIKCITRMKTIMKTRAMEEIMMTRIIMKMRTWADIAEPPDAMRKKTKIMMK